MIREKIFRLHRHKPSSSSVGTDVASAHKFDFTFSNIQAIQVPKGWDKVSLSLISSESGKVIRKTGRVPVKNGSCQWTETFSESIWISHVDSAQELEEYLFKFLVASGSSKSGTLGEITLNLAAFLHSESSMLVSLPLKKCNFGTILQVEVKCLTPKTNLRSEKWKNMHSIRDENTDHESIENHSDTSDSATAKSTESFSSNSVGNSSRPRELSSRETSFSASVSRYSFDSTDDSVGRQSFSSQTGVNNVILRQDSIESNDSYSTHGSVKSVRSHQNKHQREELRKLSNATASLLQQNGGSSKTFKEADDAMVQELDAEARMWEQNARKLSVDMERIRKELSDEKMNVTNLNAELARSHSECHELTQEIERLKLLMEESSVTQSADQNSEIQKEIRFQKQENEDLCSQLKKTQESNIELISILQEMEETIDKQKHEIESLSVADNHDQIELQNMQEVQQALQGEILFLESTLEDKIIETEIEQDLKNRLLKDFVLEYKHRLDAKDEKIMNLEASLCRALLDVKESELIEDSNEKNDGMRLKNRENNQDELVKHLSCLQEENIYLLQRVSGLEAQLRYLSDKSESSCLDLQHSESKAVILEKQITRLEEEIESEKLETKQKLLDMEKRFLEGQEECIALSRLNITLQATTENLLEEYNSVNKFNRELRDENLKLRNQCLVLQSESRKYRDEVQENLDVVLESKPRFSELERLQLADDNYLLCMQLQKVPELQNEVLSLRVLFNEIKSRNQILEASLKSVSKDNEERKRERSFMVEKIYCLQREVLEAEDCRRKKNALEEKILRLEGDLIARDALCVENAEMRNEVNRIKIANSQFLMKIKHLEEIHGESTSEFRPENREFVQPQVQVFDKQEVANVCKSQLQREKSEHKVALLEGELQEIRERYLQISLKYAEVEAEREELVMKLKALNT